jgi:hypothetical protein
MKRIIVTLGIAAVTLTAVQAQDQPTEMKDKQEMIQGEDIQIMDFSEFPEDVRERFFSSEYENAEIEESYLLKGTALEEVLGQEAMEIYIGDLPPEKLYVLQISEQDETSTVLYYREDGEIYATNEFGS